MIFLYCCLIFVLSYVNKTAGENKNESVTVSDLCGDGKWQCEDGTCIWSNYKCNYIVDCPDGSDERLEVCPRNDPCVMPPHPQYGNYSVPGEPSIRPGVAIPNNGMMVVNCKDGYAAKPKDYAFCDNGDWASAPPQCVLACELIPDFSLNYYCLEQHSSKEARLCNRYEPYGAVVKPVCTGPDYYSPHELPFMHCVDGIWDYVARCKPECGFVSESTTKYSYNGAPASYGELPWQAAIYSTEVTPFALICSGTLVSESFVISAAQCFWSGDGVKNPDDVAVSLGNLYKPWNNQEFEDTYQKYNVTSIKIPERFQGALTNYQDDIAILELEFRIVFNTFVRPACLDFDIAFDRWQLADGNEGKTGGWGIISEHTKKSPLLLVTNMKYVNIVDCIINAPRDLKPYITSDKICAEAKSQGVCRGDIGAGLVFPETDYKGRVRYYLRGVSAMPPNFNESCSTFYRTSLYTKISKHMDMILDLLNWAGGDEYKL